MKFEQKPMMEKSGDVGEFLSYVVAYWHVGVDALMKSWGNVIVDIFGILS